MKSYIKQVCKLNITILSALFLLGCSGVEDVRIEGDKVGERMQQALNKNNITDKVEQELMSAKQQLDYRLYVTSGRRTVVVGVDNPNLANIKQQCGIKFMPQTGDVLKGEDDKKARSLQLQFARLYNKKMYPYCLQNK